MALPVISVKQMREWEKATWKSGQTEKKVIAQVGKLVAEQALRLSRENDTILVLAGKGHNGDDARAALRHLSQRKTILLNCVDPKIAVQKFRSLVARNSPILILDGLFGTGLSRALDHAWQTLIAAINETEIPVLAIDVPSGIDADSGTIRGAAIRASVTLTLGSIKSGLLAPDAVLFVGKLVVAPEIGLVSRTFTTRLQWIEEKDFLHFPPRREISSHKGTFGHAVIVASSLGYHGAAVLASQSALRAQPGLVTVFTPQNVYGPVAAQSQAAMVHPWKNAIEFPESTSAILFGPGLAAKKLPSNLRKQLVTLWEKSPLPVIVDASALGWLPSREKNFAAVRIVTPHPGEAARLLSISSQAVQKNRLAALRKISSRFGNCWVVLKGHQTLVGRSEGQVLVNSSGDPFLAQGGTGDILAGYIAGLLAQRTLQNDVQKTLCFAVWQHGATADELSKTKTNWTTRDLLEKIGGARRIF
ncbi:MAG: NAD(P)H-hydrate dehydratase [Verrucomicrobiota bacterium]